MKLPGFLKKYFWDVQFEKIDATAHSRYVLARLLEDGDEKAVGWMKRHFTRPQVEEILFHYRSVSPRSANFWAVVFGIDKRKVLCLQKPYLEIRRRLWPY
jgi:hypothetical protein